MDKKEEKIVDSLIEQRKMLWTALIILSGGIAGLLISIDKIIFDLQFSIKFILLILGFFFLNILIDSINKIGQNLTKRLK
jgi:hypothetical protein